MNDKPYEISLVGQLRERRKQMRISQSKIGKKLGMSFMNVSHIERGTRGVKLDDLYKWADALNLKLSIALLEKAKVETKPTQTT